MTEPDQVIRHYGLEDLRLDRNVRERRVAIVEAVFERPAAQPAP